jgi:hypothetical protein
MVPPTAIARTANTQPSCFLCELPEVCGPFSAALAIRTVVVEPLVYGSPHSAIYQGTNQNKKPSRSKFAESRKTIFTLMDALLYGLYL